MMRDLKDLFCELILPMTLFLILFVVVLFGVFAPLIYYTSASHARIYNERNGTSYTAWDFMWAGSQINSRTQTININQPKEKP